MSTIPKPEKKRFFKRWWFWTLIILVVVLLLSTVFGADSYKEQQLASYDYLKEEVTASKRDMKKTVSTNGTISTFSLTEADLPEEIEGINVEEALAGLEEEDTEELIELAEDAVKMDFYASDSEVIELETGQDAVITISSYDNGKEEFTGEVIFVSNVKAAPNAAAALTGGSTDTGYLVSVASTELPEEVQDLQGLNVDIEVEIEEKQDVLSLEPGAVQYDDNDEPFVYLLPTIDEDFVKRAGETEDVTEVLEKKYIDVDFEGDQYIEVTDGLRDGDTVLLYVPSQGESAFGF
jgi:uncharacterized protein YuzE